MEPTLPARGPHRGWLVAAGLLVSFTLALTLRTVWVADRVVTDEEVLFQGQDAWYHVRLIENCVHNFPHRLEQDRLAPFPYGQRVDVGPFWDQLAAGVALLLGRGDPSLRQIHVVSAVLPAILGALIVLPLYVIGRVLHGRRFGLAVAVLGAVLPGSFLHRTSLGHADHHAAEGFLALSTLALILLALEREGTRARMALSVAAGLVCLAYLQTFTGGALVVAILTAWIGVQLVLDRRRGTDPEYIVSAVLPGLGLALLGAWLAGGSAAWAVLERGTLLTAVVLLAVAVPLSRWIKRNTSGSPVGVLGLAVAVGVLVLLGVAGMRLVAPEAWSSVRDTVLGWFRPTGMSRIVETEPLLDGFELRPLWRQLAALGFLAPFGWILVARRALARGEPRFVLLGIWSAVALALVLVQVRFLYYTAPVTAVLAAVLCRQIVIWAVDPEAPTRLPSRVTAVAIGALAFVPTLLLALSNATVYSGPNPSWVEALRWLRDETPPPVPRSAFDRTFTGPDSRFRFDDDAYSVLSWWDDGYRVLSTGRLPVAIPTQQGAGEAAAFYAALRPRDAEQVLRRWRTRYVVTDHTLPFLVRGGTDLSGKFPQLALRAGQATQRYFRVYRMPEEQGGGLRTLFLPAYYRSPLVRLYVFGGRAVRPTEAWVATWTPEPRDDGPPVRRIVRLERYDSMKAARDFIRANPGRHDLVGVDPTLPCVPVRAAGRYREVFASRRSVGVVAGQPLPAVRIFEYLQSPAERPNPEGIPEA